MRFDLETGGVKFNMPRWNQSDGELYYPDGSIVAEYQQIIEYWKRAVKDKSFLAINNDRYNDIDDATGLRKRLQSWGCAVSEQPQLMCLDVGSARTFGQGKTIVGWTATSDNQQGLLSGCNVSLADGSGFTENGVACGYAANGTDVTESQFFQQLVIDVQDQEYLQRLYNSWVSSGVGDDPRFGGYVCGANGDKRYNDGVVDVFDMTLLAYVIFNIPPYEDIHKRIIDRVPVPASYMSESIEAEFMGHFKYDAAGNGYCSHRTGGDNDVHDKDSGLQFYAHFTELNQLGKACPVGSYARNRTGGTDFSHSSADNPNSGSLGNRQRRLMDERMALIRWNHENQRHLETSSFPLTSFVIFQWARVPSAGDFVGGTWTECQPSCSVCIRDARSWRARAAQRPCSSWSTQAPC